MKLKTVGKNVTKFDSFEKVTGEAVYIADIVFPNTLHLKIVRSTIPHGIIKNIFSEEARRVNGVKGIITGEKTGILAGICIYDQPPIARGKVRYVGEPLAVVAAETERAAERAASLVRAEYQELPHVEDPVKAADKSAPLLHDNLKNYFHLEGFNPIPGTNIFHHYHLEKGNINSGFKKADVIIERTYSFPHIAHAQIEPHGAAAKWSKGRELHIYSSTQGPFIVRGALSRMFGIPQNLVRVTVPYLGGGFGGKSDLTIEPLTAYVAKFFPGRWVRLILTREEMFYGSLVGRGTVSRMKMGFTREGRIVAAEVKVHMAAGAYGDYAINIVTGTGHNATGPYEIENVNIDSYGVYTNTPPVGAYRGYGHPEAHWMTERHMDIAARELQIDPVKLRLKNILRPGSENNLGQIIKKTNGDLEGTILKAVKEIELDKKKPSKDSRYAVGKSVAALMKSPVMSTSAGSSVIIRANRDGTFHLLASHVDMGQGSITALSQIVAETLGVDIKKIHHYRGVDTEFTPYEWQTVASSTTWKAGSAARRAALSVLDRFKEIASHVFNLSKDVLTVHDEKVWYKDRGIAFADLAEGYVYPDGHAIGGPVIGTGSIVPHGLTYPDKKTGRGELAAEWTFGCQAAEVEVDKKTGRIRVKKFVTALDVGKVINPMLARGQVEGAVVQGIGAALNETLVYGKDGRVRNSNLTDYKIPTPEDTPDALITVFLETPQPDGPFGARPLAEHGIVSVAPAIANAVRDAIGIDFYDLPLNQDRVLKAIYERGEER
ncbi:MAG: xanthine dehydrogenase family protein molybdopterin-binding subunit [Spirochaetales bacterium]|nr:xanthine dehydrogenase family protein molybdopterin-binding subunit [Spirochaetales bacterium]